MDVRTPLQRLRSGVGISLILTVVVSALLYAAYQRPTVTYQWTHPTQTVHATQ